MAKILKFKKIWNDTLAEHPEIEYIPLQLERNEWLLWDHEKEKWVRRDSGACSTAYTKSIYAAKRYTLTKGRLFVDLWSHTLRQPDEVAPPMYSMIHVEDIPLGSVQI